MEIRTDVYRIPESQVRSAAPSNPRVQTESVQPFQQSSPRREYLNAMNLMHTASGIIQEALNASSQLRSLAMTTIFDGGPNYSEVVKTVAGIQSSLQQFGQPVIVPVVQEANKPVIDLPEIRSNIDHLGAMAQEKKVNLELLAQIEKSLQHAKTSVDVKIQAAGKEYGFREFNPAESREISKSLSANPALALAAQGNIAQETAGFLLR